MEPELHHKPIRFYEIDLLRFLAALSVVFYHYTYRGYQEGHYSPVAYPSLAPYTKYGSMGVQLFFIISGYVVLLSAKGKTPRQFLLSRITRLYPAFWAAATLTFAALFLTRPHLNNQALTVSWHEYFVNMTMLFGFTGTRTIDSAYWSLTIEITFYFLIALVIGWNLYKALPWLLAFWLLYTAAVGPNPGIPSPFVALFFPGQAPLFIAGMSFYMLQNKWFAAWKLYTLLGACWVLALRSAHSDIVTVRYFFADPAFSFAVAAVATTFFFGLFFLVINRLINLSRYRWLSSLGNLTYPLYLVHSSIGYLIFEYVGDRVNKYVLLASIIMLMLFIAYIIHKVVEKRLSKPLGNITNKLIDVMTA